MTPTTTTPQRPVVNDSPMQRLEDLPTPASAVSEDSIDNKGTVEMCNNYTSPGIIK